MTSSARLTARKEPTRRPISASHAMKSARLVKRIAAATALHALEATLVTHSFMETHVLTNVSMGSMAIDEMQIVSRVSIRARLVLRSHGVALAARCPLLESQLQHSTMTTSARTAAL